MTHDFHRATGKHSLDKMPIVIDIDLIKSISVCNIARLVHPGIHKCNGLLIKITE